MKRFVLFDFDGVIADSYGLSFDVSKKFHPELDDKSYRALFEKNVYEALKELPSFTDGHPERYFAIYEPRMKDEITLASGMDECVKRLAEEYTLAIISSTPSRGISEFLARHDLSEYFAEVLGQDVHTSKVEKIAMVFEKYEVGAPECVFITDTLGDMREAQAHGVGSIGVSWGMHSRETLEQGVPFRIVESALELTDAVEDYFTGS